MGYDADRQRQSKSSLGDSSSSSKGASAGPRVLKAAWKRPRDEELAEESAAPFDCDDDDDDDDETYGTTSKKKARGGPKDEIRSYSFGSFETNFGRGPFAKLVQEAVSDDPTLVGQFLLRLAPLFGDKIGLPVHAASFWKAIIQDLHRLMVGKSGLVAKWKNGVVSMRPQCF
jgi:hypothetical protein